MTLRPAHGRPICTEIEVRRSRFITTIQRASSENEAREAISRVRAEMPDARHHCSAFIIDVAGATPLERSSDDGEPSGTAGMPMLDVLRGSDLTDTVAVVSRYFGGIKLGTGGLVRAYSDSVRSAVALTPLVELTLVHLWQIELTHTEAGRVESELRSAGYAVDDVAYGQDVTLTLASNEEPALRSAVASLTSGQATIRAAGTRIVEEPASG